MTKCPWCGKPIEVRSRTVVRKAIKLSSVGGKIKQSAASPLKGEEKDKIEVVAPPAKTKVRSKAKSKKNRRSVIKIQVGKSGKQ